MSTVSHTFTWSYSPDATTVVVTGSFDNWTQSVTLKKDETNVFSATVELPVDTEVIYKFVVDGAWMHDLTLPNQTDDKANINNVLVTPKQAEETVEEVEKPATLWIQPHFKINDPVEHVSMSAVIETVPDSTEPAATEVQEEKQIENKEAEEVIAEEQILSTETPESKLELIKAADSEATLAVPEPQEDKTKTKKSKKSKSKKEKDGKLKSEKKLLERFKSLFSRSDRYSKMTEVQDD
ncbi:immunoglobulin E-set [Paraphysoderma sedebokerense]|nr:immunoglobulin E-set [Paraphysoderma sedebokerense]